MNILQACFLIFSDFKMELEGIDHYLCWRISRMLFTFFPWEYSLKLHSNDTSISDLLKKMTTNLFPLNSPPHIYLYPPLIAFFSSMSPCFPNLSWFTAITSLFPNIAKVLYDMLLKSHPIKRGDFKRAQRAKWDWYSSCDIPPFPTSSISGSFQAPGPAYFDNPSCLSRLWIKDTQTSLMSIVVLQEFPTFWAHSYGFYLPHSHIEK